MTHEQATNILRRYYGPDYADRAFVRILGEIAIATGVQRIMWEQATERARTRHIVRGLIRR